MSVYPLPEPTPDPVVVFASFAESLIDVITGVAISAVGDVTIGDFLEAIKDIPLKDAITAFVNGAGNAA